MHLLQAEESASTGRRPEGGGRPQSDGGRGGRQPGQDSAARIRGRTITLDINVRLVEHDQTVILNESQSKETSIGRPVSIQLVGDNLVISVQFTMYFRQMRGFLVAQGQIWMEIPDEGIRHHTTMQTIPVEFGEPVLFFPLGSIDNDDARIEIMVTVQPHEEN